MNFDEEAPPLLVNVDGEDDESFEETKSIKVPITIVTGKVPAISLVDFSDWESRISWSWKDYLA
jgi:hypothetical protein